jgi:FkbM family methyltransferase
MKSTLFEKIFNFIDKYYYLRNISIYLNKLKINTVIDVGFHKGEFIENFFLYQKKKIYAFEPNPKIFIYSKKKFKNNKKIKIFNYCLSDKIKNRKFYINYLSSTSSLLNNSKIYDNFKKFLLHKKDLKYSINLKTLTLDFAIMKNKISLKNALLKIDTEGSEYAVLKGTKKNIKKMSYILLENKFLIKDSFKNKNKIDLLLLKNNFVLIKRFIYPLFNFEDRLYANKSL